MLFVYIACLIFGGTLLAFSIFFGSDHGSDSDAHHTFDGDDISEIDLDASHEISSEGHTNMSSLSHSDVDSIKFLSFRNIVFFMTFFGMTGVAFTLFEFNSLISLVFAISVGIFSWLFGYKLTKYLKVNETGEAFSIYQLKGHIAKVTIPVGKEKKGKILFQAKGESHSIHALLAQSDNQPLLDVNESVIVIDIIDNVAICIKNDL